MRKIGWRIGSAFIAICALFSTSGLVQSSESKTLRAAGAWAATGGVVPTGQAGFEFVGIAKGVMYVDTGREWINAAKLTCTTRISVNPRLEQKGEGRCLITTDGGDKVYAAWTCRGADYTCNGDFTFTGGTGRFKGIKGGGPFKIRSGLSESMRRPGGLVIQNSVGLVSWPSLKYTIP